MGFLRNIGGTLFTSLRLRISTTSTDPIGYTVESGDGFIHQGTVSSSLPSTVSLPSSLQVESSDFTYRNRGIRVSTNSDSVISVIGENFVFPFNHGAFLAYPCLRFETDIGYEYYAVSAEASTSFRSQLLIVGCEDDTEISVTPSQNITLPDNLQVDGSPLVSLQAGSAKLFSLKQMQTFLVTSSIDLTGTKIISNKPLTVISGHECASVPPFSSGCEPLAVYIPPSITWGNFFLLAPFAGRDAGSVYKIVPTDTTSALITCGTSSFRATILANGFSFTVTDTFCSLSSFKPVLIVQLAQSNTLDRKGDPAVTLISPTDQYINTIHFLALPSNDFSASYVSVTVTSEHFNPTSILLNGEILSCEWSPIYNLSASAESIVGYGCNLTVDSQPNSPTQHKISHSEEDGLLSVLVYGFSSETSIFDVGYAYLAGQNIEVSGESIYIAYFTLI